jgi:carboxymethylenebutenolidase
VVLPDVRGLYRFYEELALRFAEEGIDALAIDYFGRTAVTDTRPPDFDHTSHVQQVTWDGLSADIRAGAEHLRSRAGDSLRTLFSVGFCFGGRISFDAGTLSLGLAGSIGFYGIPVGPGRGGVPAPVDVVNRMEAPILGLFGGADGAILPEARDQFEAALTRAGVDHRLVTYDGAPHSFFDKKAEEYAEASSAAWSETLAFIRSHAT